MDHRIPRGVTTQAGDVQCFSEVIVEVEAEFRKEFHQYRKPPCMYHRIPRGVSTQAFDIDDLIQVIVKRGCRIVNGVSSISQAVVHGPPYTTRGDHTGL